MSRDDNRLAELPLPLGPDADILDALRAAVAIEDAYGIVLPEDRITVRDLESRESVASLLASLSERS